MHIPQTEVILRHDGAELARVTLPPGEYVIGRNPDADIRADTPLLSRQHARLIIAADHVLIEDLRSSNGTFVGDQPIAGPTRLVPGLAVRLGNVTVEIRFLPTPAPAPLATVHRLLPAEVLTSRRYDLGNVIAQGGMGAILDAQQAAMKRQVAMKIMLAEDAAPDAVARFIEEAQVTGQLEHPNIVPVHELGVDDRGQPFYTMKMVRGITLGKVLKLLAEGVPATVAKYPLPVLLTIFQKVCDALAFAHSKGVIHRDLKPDNIMLDDFGVVLVMDWGLVKVISRGGHRAVDAPAPGTDGAVPSIAHSAVHSARAAEPEFSGTLEGTIMGTPQYMAPEQARGEIETLDARADFYALGGILYTILALRPPVTGRRIAEVLDKVQRGEIEPLHGAAKSTSPPATAAPEARRGHGRSGLRPSLRIPDSLAAVVAKAMAFDREHRYPRVENLQADLLAYQTGFATSAENAGLGRLLLLALRRHKTTALAAALVLLAAGGFGTRALLEGRRAEQALADLRSTAPNFIDQAATLVTANDLPGALKKATAATKLAPDVAEYRVFRAHLLLAIPNLRDAAHEYQQALALHPGDGETREHLALCEELLRSEPDAAKLSAGALNRIHALTVKYGRASHAVYLLRERQGERKQLLAAWRKVLEDHGILAANALAASLKLSDDGTFYLKVGGGATDLSALKGMPVTELVMLNTEVVDLRPLSGLPLRKLNMQETKPADFEPLRGLKLEELDLSKTGIESLEPLRGMPLRKLRLQDNERVKDLTPLRGMPLVVGDLRNQTSESRSAVFSSAQKTGYDRGPRAD